MRRLRREVSEFWIPEFLAQDEDPRINGAQPWNALHARVSSEERLLLVETLLKMPRAIHKAPRFSDASGRAFVDAIVASQHSRYRRSEWQALSYFRGRWCGRVDATMQITEKRHWAVILSRLPRPILPVRGRSKHRRPRRR